MAAFVSPLLLGKSEADLLHHQMEQSSVEGIISPQSRRKVEQRSDSGWDFATWKMLARTNVEGELATLWQ